MCCWCMSDVYQICTQYLYCGVMACVCSRCSVYVHVLTLDVCMEEWVLCLHFLAINTQSNRTKTTVKVSSEAMAQLVEYSLTMWEVLGSKPSWICVFVVVDVGVIFFYLQKMMQKSFFSKNKLSGDMGLMVQMLNLNFVAAAVSNYWENLFLLKMEKGE